MMRQSQSMQAFGASGAAHQNHASNLQMTPASAAFNQLQAQYVKQMNAHLANLQDVTKVDWQKRTESIQQISQLVDRAMADANLEPDAASHLLQHLFTLMAGPLNTQLLDLRSTVTRETIDTLVHFARTYPSEFGCNSAKYFSGSDGFLKLLNNGKRLISDMAHEGITQILNEVCIPKIIEVLIAQFRSKNSLVRLRVATYFEIIVQRYDIDYLIRSQKAFEADFLLKGIDDQSQDVRKQVRLCWQVYYEVEEFTDRVNNLVRDMRNGPAKKQLQQELATCATNDSSTVLEITQANLSSPSKLHSSSAKMSSGSMQVQGRAPSARQSVQDSQTAPPSKAAPNVVKRSSINLNSAGSKQQIAAGAAILKRTTGSSRPTSREKAKSYLRAKYSGNRQSYNSSTLSQNKMNQQSQPHFATVHESLGLNSTHSQSMKALPESCVGAYQHAVAEPASMRGVKHVIANLDDNLSTLVSAQKLRKQANFDNNLLASLNNSSSGRSPLKRRQQHLSNSMMKNKTSRHSKNFLASAALQKASIDLEMAAKPKHQAAARHVMLTLDKRTSGKQPSFEGVDHIVAEQQHPQPHLFNTVTAATALQASSSQHQFAGKQHNRCSSLSSDQSQNKTLYKSYKKNMGTAKTSRNGSNSRIGAGYSMTLSQQVMAQAISTASAGKHQKIQSTGKAPQSHSFNKYHSSSKLETARPIPSKNLFRMAERFRKTGRVALKSPQQQPGAKTLNMPFDSMRPPHTGSGEVINNPSLIKQTEPSSQFFTVDPPEIIHLATEVPNDRGYDEDMEPQAADPGQSYLPVATEEHEMLDSYVVDHNQTATFTSHNRSISRIKAVSKARRHTLKRSHHKRQTSFDSELSCGNEIAPPRTARARSTSQYYHHLDEQSHQMLIDSAVTKIQQEKMLKESAAASKTTCNSKSNRKHESSFQVGRRQKSVGAIRHQQQHAQGSKTSRLMFSPRAASRKSHRNKQVNRGEAHRSRHSSKNSSIASKPDSPIKINPTQHNDRPQLPQTSGFQMHHNFTRQVGRGSLTARASPKINNPETAATQKHTKNSSINTTVAENSGPIKLMKNLPSQQLTLRAPKPTLKAAASTLILPKDEYMGTTAHDSSTLLSPNPKSARYFESGSSGRKDNESQSLIKLQPMMQTNFIEAMDLTEGKCLTDELKAYISDPSKDAFWREYANDVMEYLQEQIEQGYKKDETRRHLYLIGKILRAHRHLITLKLKGVLLDRIFNLLRDSEIHRVPSRTFSEIMSHVRSDNLGWRFFVDSINKLHEAGETDDLFFEKGLNIVRGLLRSMPTFDQSLINLFIDHTLVPYFENQSTVVRKQVVVTLAELRLAMETRLQTQCALYEITFESLMEGKLKAGSLKLVQIYFERLIKDMANTSISHLNQCSSDTGYRAFYEESYSSELLSGAASTQTANQRSSKQQQLSNLLQNGSQDN